MQLQVSQVLGKSASVASEGYKESCIGIHLRDFKMRNHKPHRRGFTLIELLTVIAIIGILAAILIPVVGRVRDSARASQCVSNLRQSAIALQVHLSENDGRFISGKAADAPAGREDVQWAVALLRSGAVQNRQDVRAFFCPSQSAIETDGGFPSEFPPDFDDVWGWRTYGYNMFSDDLIEFEDATSSGNSMFDLNANAIQDPSRYPVFMDSVDARGFQRFALKGNAATDRYGVHLRHSGRANVAFLDGHVESSGQRELYLMGLVSGYDEDKNIVVFPRVQ